MTLVSPLLDPLLLERLAGLELRIGRIAEGSAGGVRRTSRLGSSLEFHQHRPFVAGESPRQVDWRVYGRTGRLHTREFHDETNLRAVLMLDCSGSMAYGRHFDSKFSYARRLMASLAFILLSRRESVGLACFTEKLKIWLAPSAVSLQLPALLEHLGQAQPAGKSDLVRSAQAVVDRMPRRGLVAIVSDLLQPVEQLTKSLAILRHRRHEVIVMRILDSDEVEFTFDRPIQFRGLEGETSVVRDPRLLRDQYRRRFSVHEAQLRQACDREDVDLWRFTTDQPLEDALPHHLGRPMNR